MSEVGLNVAKALQKDEKAWQDQTDTRLNTAESNITTLTDEFTTMSGTVDILKQQYDANTNVETYVTEQLAPVNTKIGDPTQLTTAAKTVVPAINENKGRLDGHDTAISLQEGRLGGHDTTLTSHADRLTGHDNQLANMYTKSDVDLKLAITSGAFTYYNNFGEFDSGTPCWVKKNSSGLVTYYLLIIGNGTSTSGTTCAIFPTGFRPAKRMLLRGYVDTPGDFLYYINPDGGVVFARNFTSTSSSWLVMQGSFYAV